MLNADETDFLLNPRSTKALAAKGHQHVYQQVNNEWTECQAVPIATNCESVPIIYKYSGKLFDS